MLHLTDTVHAYNTCVCACVCMSIYCVVLCIYPELFVSTIEAIEAMEPRLCVFIL